MTNDASRDPLELRIEGLEKRIEEISDALENLESRFSALAQGNPAPVSLLPPGEPGDPALGFELPATGTLLNLLTQVGRSCLILGGGFLLRSLTDAGIFARSAGATLGLAYACLWILLANRSAKLGRRSSAAYLAVTAVVIAYPLIAETTTRWPVFSPGGAAAATTAMTALCLGVAWRRNLPSLAWTAAGAAVLTAFALTLLTGVIEPFAAALLVIGIAGAWSAYGSHHWHLLRWPLAAAADVLVLWAAFRLISEEPSKPSPVISFLCLAFLLPCLYMGSFGLRTLARRRDVTAFEVLQTVAALLIGFGGAAAVARRFPNALVTLGVSALVIGAGCYVVAFVFVERQQRGGRNFLFYATLALLLTLSGSALATRGLPLSLLWGALALASAFLGTRPDRATLAVHACVYVLAAAWQTGLIRSLADAFGGMASQAFLPPTASGLATIGIAAACYAILVRERERARATLPRAILVLVAVLGIGAYAIGVFRRVAGGQPPGSDPGGIAALRTAILASAAFLFAAARRRTRLPEFTGLAYTTLAIATAKLLVEDLPRGRASTLFVGFIFYGLALLVTPRLLKGSASAERDRPATGDSGSPAPRGADPTVGSPRATPRS